MSYSPLMWAKNIHFHAIDWCLTLTLAIFQLYRGVNKFCVYLDTHFHAKFNENNIYFVHNLYKIFMFNNAFSIGDKQKLWFLHGPISTHLENYVVIICHFCPTYIGGVMVSVLASSVVDRGFESRSGQTSL